MSALLAASASLLFAFAFALDGCGSKESSPLDEPQSQPQPPRPNVGACPDYVFCIRGDHWDSTLCRCVPNQEDAGAMQDASAPSEAAVDAGTTAPDSSTDACPPDAPDAAMADDATGDEEASTACDGSDGSAP